MRINHLLQNITGFLILAVACSIPTHTLAQADGEKDKAAPQEKKTHEAEPAAPLRSGIEILSDTTGVDFGPYMQRLKSTVQAHWNLLIPESAYPPMMKSGIVTIEFAIAKSGQVIGMKLVKSSGDVPLDRAAWGGITKSMPLPALPPEFTGEYLLLRCRFLYNPEKAESAKAPEPAEQAPKK